MSRTHFVHKLETLFMVKNVLSAIVLSIR